MLPRVNVCVAYMVLFIIVSLKRILKHKLNTPFSKVNLCNYATKSQHRYAIKTTIFSQTPSQVRTTIENLKLYPSYNMFG